MITRKQQKAMFAKQNGIKIVKHNRFNDRKHSEWLWGDIVAVSDNNKKAILIAKNQSIDTKGVQWGKLYQVSAKKVKVGRKKFPVLELDRQVTKVPKRDWKNLQ